MKKKLNQQCLFFISAKFCQNCQIIHSGQCQFSYLASFQTLYIYDSLANKFTPHPIQIPHTLYCASISACGCIFDIGGKNPILNTVVKHNIPHHKDIMCQPHPIKSYAHAVCFSSAFIYCMGGADESSELKNCLKYSVMHNKWIPLIDTPYSFLNGIAFVLSNALYFLTSVIVKLDLLNPNEWVTADLPSINHINQMKSVAISNKEVLIFNGESCETYIINENAKVRQLAVRMLGKCNLINCPCPAFINGTVYASDTKGRIHLFLNKKEWWMVSNGKIFSPTK